MLKGLAGPLADLTLCPTGGISEDNAAEFLAQPNVACVGGSWMVPKPWLAAGEWDKVRDASLRAAGIVANTRAACSRQLPAGAASAAPTDVEAASRCRPAPTLRGSAAPRPATAPGRPDARRL